MNFKESHNPRVVTVVGVCLMLWSLAHPALAQENRGKAQAENGATLQVGDFKLGPDDLLHIAVWKNENLSRDVPVRPDGMISMPLVNDVRAQGLTPMELREVLTRRFSEFIPNPEVSVIVKEIHSPKASVLGEVVHPGRYDIKGRTTVLDALALAGGLTEFASRSRIVVLRDGGTRVTRLRFNYDKAVMDGETNFEVRPGDIILVR
jgi:polysaccharide biosynthesis/export protein